MTLPNSGPLTVTDINVEIQVDPYFNSSLSFLNGKILPGQRPPKPTMGAFYNLAYYQSTNNGNCNNGNCNNQNGPNGNCPNNCNCGNIQCRNCYISGPWNCSNCVNCVNVDCANCDAQPWLQNNCNCACTYNCAYSTPAPQFNCNTTQTASYNCACACNCSKIVCAKLYEFGMMSPDIWSADQAYGHLLRKTDKRVYRGYIKWARIVTAWMEGAGPTFMPWVKGEAARSMAQRSAMIDMAQKIGTPWSEHMAYLMGTLKTDNTMGRMLMTIGKPLCRVASYIPKSRKRKNRHGLTTTWTIWACLYFSYYTAKALTAVIESTKLKAIKERIYG